MGFGPTLCTYRLNWARWTSRGWWAEWDVTAFQTQVSKIDPQGSEAEHATSRSWRFPTILNPSGVWTRDLRLSKQAALKTLSLRSCSYYNLHLKHRMLPRHRWECIPESWCHVWKSSFPICFSACFAFSQRQCIWRAQRTSWFINSHQIRQILGSKFVEALKNQH